MPAYLVVGMHDRHQRRVALQGSAHIVRIHNSLPVHRQPRHLRPERFKKPARLQHGRMLNLAGDDMKPPARRILARY